MLKGIRSRFTASDWQFPPARRNEAVFTRMAAAPARTARPVDPGHGAAQDLKAQLRAAIGIMFTDSTQAVARFRKVLAQLGEDGDPTLQGEALLGLARILPEQDRRQASLDFQKVLRRLMLNGDAKLLRARLHDALGDCLFTMDRMQAARHYRMGLALLGPRGDPAVLARLHHGLGLCSEGETAQAHFAAAARALGDWRSMD